MRPGVSGAGGGAVIQPMFTLARYGTGRGVGKLTQRVQGGLQGQGQRAPYHVKANLKGGLKVNLDAPKDDPEMKKQGYHWFPDETLSDLLKGKSNVSSYTEGQKRLKRESESGGEDRQYHNDHVIPQVALPDPQQRKSATTVRRHKDAHGKGSTYKGKMKIMDTVSQPGGKQTVPMRRKDALRQYPGLGLSMALYDEPEPGVEDFASLVTALSRMAQNKEFDPSGPSLSTAFQGPKNQLLHTVNPKVSMGRHLEGKLAGLTSDLALRLAKEYPGSGIGPRPLMSLNTPQTPDQILASGATPAEMVEMIAAWARREGRSPGREKQLAQRYVNLYLGKPGKKGKPATKGAAAKKGTKGSSPP